MNGYTMINHGLKKSKLVRAIRYYHFTKTLFVLSMNIDYDKEYIQGW
jgi:hypothetical protein